MKYLLLFFLPLSSISVRSQSLQLHYDFRHSVDPKHNAKNFPTLFFEYFKGGDSGSFLLKTQGDFIGEKNNIGKFYTQVSHSFRFWQPKIFLQLEYSGGLGISEPGSYGFYLTNAFSLGLGHPFQWWGAWLNAYTCYSFSNFKKPSHDALFSFYWWKGFFNYKLEFSGDFSLWTRNKNRGDSFTMNEKGKRFSFFGEPQLWFNASTNFSVGSKINLYYHVLVNENVFQVYPTAAIKYKF
jgi:hypothetical protein